MLNLRSKRNLLPRGYQCALSTESLEPRRLLAAEVFAFQNPADAMDVTHDSFVTPADALTIVNTLNGFDLFNGKVGAYLDTSGDNIVAPNDVIGIINHLNGATPTELDAIETDFEFASAYCVQHFDDIPDGMKSVAQKFIDATNDLASSKLLRDAAIAEFLDFSLDNSTAIIARYREIEVATGVITKDYRQDLQELGPELTELVSTNYPVDPNDLDEYPGEYDFEPDDFGNIDEVFDELFNEIDGVVGDIEIPDYGDVIDNFDDVFQTYDDSNFGLDEFVGGLLETDEYDHFVLDGHNIGELVDDIENIYDTGSDFDDFVTDEFGSSDRFINVLEGMVEASYIGELIFNDVVAIGGETTGSNIILGDGSVVEIDLGDDPELLALAAAYDNTAVLIEGVEELISGVEIPTRTVIDVTALVGQQELDTLQLLLLTDVSSMSGTVLSQFLGALPI